MKRQTSAKFIELYQKGVPSSILLYTSNIGFVTLEKVDQSMHVMTLKATSSCLPYPLLATKRLQR